MASPAYQDGSTAVFVTYDSDDKSAKNHIATMVIAPSVKPGTVASGAYNHYSMLRTIEDMLGLPGHLGCAATAPSMRAASQPVDASRHSAWRRCGRPRAARNSQIVPFDVRA